MAKLLIKNRQLEQDRWTLVRDAEAGVPDGPVIVPLAYWKQQRDSRAGADFGVWLAPADDPAELADAIADLPVIALDFPQFVDGRSYSNGRLLRERYGFTGELRAVGDVLRDQLYAMEQVGFNAFSVREDRNPAQELAGLQDFSTGYQVTFLREQALFRHVR